MRSAIRKNCSLAYLQSDSTRGVSRLLAAITVLSSETRPMSCAPTASITSSMVDCVFRSIFEHQHLRVKSYSFSSLLNKNIDIRKNTERFKKVNFSAAPSLSLYDKLKDGGCRIQLITYDEKIIPYQSVSASHIAGTNLITIKFKRGNNELF